MWFRFDVLLSLRVISLMLPETLYDMLFSVFSTFAPLFFMEGPGVALCPKSLGGAWLPGCCKPGIACFPSSRNMDLCAFIHSRILFLFTCGRMD